MDISVPYHIYVEIWKAEPQKGHETNYFEGNYNKSTSDFKNHENGLQYVKLEKSWV